MSVHTPVCKAALCSWALTSQDEITAKHEALLEARNPADGIIRANAEKVA
jgi:hypothetical protein